MNAGVVWMYADVCRAARGTGAGRGLPRWRQGELSLEVVRLGQISEEHGG